MWTAIFIWLSLLTVLTNPTAPPCEATYGGCHHYGGYYPPPPPPPPKPKFLPAPPGKTPKCAKPGSTFCEKIDHYPKDLIHYLVQKWDYDYNTLFADESTEDFNPKPTPAPTTTTTTTTYGPPPSPYGKQPGYDYTPKFHAKPYAQNLKPPIQPANQSLEFPYPARRFPLHYGTDAVAPSARFELYPALTAPPVSYYDPGYWWKRYRRNADREKRQSSSTSTFTLCPTRSQFVMPQAAVNNKGNWMYVVNINEVDNRYKQLVKSEVCLSTECNGVCGLPPGYTSRCEQKYVQKRLIALQGEGNQLYTDVFWIPSCCVCQITPAS
ncbi:hypothetical protein M8J76_010830 [Diaphorina citri]|nr:hypothetical protein M8J76_010830 [Diaphorina citri]